MPYDIYIDEKSKGFITIYSGHLTNDEFIKCTQEKFAQGKAFLSKEYINSFNYSLSDCTGITKFDVDIEALKNNASLSGQALAQSTSGVMLVVAPEDLEYGLGRLWQTYAENGAERVRLFRSRQEAEDWIVESFG